MSEGAPFTGKASKISKQAPLSWKSSNLSRKDTITVQPERSHDTDKCGILQEQRGESLGMLKKKKKRGAREKWHFHGIFKYGLSISWRTSEATFNVWGRKYLTVQRHEKVQDTWNYWVWVWVLLSVYWSGTSLPESPDSFKIPLARIESHVHP